MPESSFRGMTTVMEEANIKTDDKPRKFKPKTRAFFKDLSKYKKKEGRAKFYSKYTALRFRLTSIELMLIKLNQVSNHSKQKIKSFGSKLSRDSVYKISKELGILFRNASRIRFLIFNTTNGKQAQSQSLKVLEGFIFIPLFKAIKSILNYLEAYGNLFNFKMSIYIFNFLKQEIQRLKRYPPEIRNQNLDNFYFTALSLYWSVDHYNKLEKLMSTKSNLLT